SLEYTSSLLQRLSYRWVLPILAKGACHILAIQDLPGLDPKLSTIAIAGNISSTWRQRERPEGKWSLCVALWRCLGAIFMSVLWPRLFSTIFRFAQPIVIRETLRTVSTPAEDNEDTRTRVFWIIVLAIVAYFGYTISTVQFERSSIRIKTAIRSALVHLIYDHVLEVQALSEGFDGAPITLMSADVDNFVHVGVALHDFWSFGLESIIAVVLISHEVGYLIFAPVFVLVSISALGVYLASRLRVASKSWLEAIEDRIGASSHMIRFMKSIKSLGLTEVFSSRIQRLRMAEIMQAVPYRWLDVVSSSLIMSTPAFTSATVLVLLALLIRRKFDAEQLFTLVSLLSLLTYSYAHVLKAASTLLSSFASYERIQNYLLESTRLDQRNRVAQHPSRSKTLLPTISLQAINVEMPDQPDPILQNLDLDIFTGGIYLIHGPVGSGKTTLAKAILGEIPISKGTISVSSKKMGYCSQSPWLVDSTVRDGICGFDAKFDLNRYQEAIQACCLDHDLASFSLGDEKGVGSSGFNLSGGQKQRLALARATYTHTDTVILDDSFSALDPTTRRNVMNHLLGADGVFRRRHTTVIWFSNDVHGAALADRVFCLNRGRLEMTQQAGSPQTIEERETSSLLFDQSSPGNPTNHQQVAQFKAKELSGVSDNTTTNPTRMSEDMSLYGFYMRSSGWVNTCAMVACAAGFSFSTTFPSYWLKLWVAAAGEHATFYIVGCVTFALTAFLSHTGSSFAANLRMAPKAASTLHNNLLKTVLQAPLSYFSVTNEGTILSRFGQDLRLIDTELPRSLHSLVNQILTLTIQFAILCSVQRWVTLLVPCCVCIIYTVRAKYLKTARYMQLMEMESRSDLYSSFLETIQGVMTIRAMGLENEFRERNLERLDVSQRAFYISMSLKRWLNLMLNSIEAGIAVTVIALAVHFRGVVSGSDVGVALSVLIQTSAALRELVYSWADVEISLSAVERLRQMETLTPSEDNPSKTGVPETSWPAFGEVELTDVSVSYGDGNLVLNKMSLQVSPGQKLIICGRTGSGKSTLFNSLLRLVDLSSGSIKIDGVDISQVPRSLVRQRCFITVPQETFTIPKESLRYNLDLYQKGVSDFRLVQALSKTGLWAKLTGAADCPHKCNRASLSPFLARTILSSSLESLPQLSKGQQQLLSITQLLVGMDYLDSDMSFQEDGTKTKPILLLDEATSSLDYISEEIVHRVIDEEFVARGHTVLMISHRPEIPAHWWRPGRDAIIQLYDRGLKTQGSNTG
ncbi:P-loop containing nucleoside triphosphate hydrolase protein, partial [Thozetella sp. PMI_491]